MDGIGTLIRRLYAKDAEDDLEGYVGKAISSVSLTGDHELRMLFTDGTGLSFRDEGQSCCEGRFMSTDDDLSEYTGARLLGAAVKDGPDRSNEKDEDGYTYESYQTQFLDIMTTRGTFQMVNHVIHNGYYGGFALITSEVTP